MRGPHIGRDLSQPGTDLSRDLALHQLAGDQDDRLTNESPSRPSIVLATTSATVMLSPSAIVVFSFTSTAEQPTSLNATVVRTTTRRPLHHFYQQPLRRAGISAGGRFRAVSFV
jgi:hypothetical protein